MTTLEPFTVYYHQNAEPAVVTTLTELETLIDGIESGPRYHDVPPLLEIVAADEKKGLDVGLCRPYTVLLWYDEDAAEHLASAGTLTPPEVPAFNYGGTWTEIPPAHAVPAQLARPALREFFTTGRRPTCVTWQTKT